MSEITKIEPLNGKNYQSWKYNMKLVLMERGLWGFTQEGQEVPPTASAAERNAYRLRSDKAYSLIALSIEKNLQVHIASTVNPKEAWDILQNHFEFVSVTQIVRLNRKFYAASMKEGDDLMEHITYMTALAEQLREMKEDISSKKFATVILGSLPESYDNFMTSLNARNAEEIEWEDIKGLLVEEFIKRKEKKEKHSFDDALFVKRGAAFNRGRGQARGGRGNNSRRGSYGGKRFSSGAVQEQQHHDDSRDAKGPRCFKCNQFGHIEKNCPQNKRNAGRNEHSNIGENSLSDDEKYEDVALLSSTKNRTNEWFIDSGATKHMTFDRSIIINFVKYEHPLKIYLGDSTVVLAQGEGKVRLPTCYGSDDVFSPYIKYCLYPN